MRDSGWHVDEGWRLPSVVLAVAVGTDDKGKTGASAEKIEIIRVRSILTDTEDL